MAIDTETKRRRAARAARRVRGGHGLAPDGTLDASDRAIIAGRYRPSDVWTAVTENNSVTWTNVVGRND